MTEKRYVKWPGTDVWAGPFEFVSLETGTGDTGLRTMVTVQTPDGEYHRLPADKTKPAEPEIPDDELVVWVDGGGSRRLNKFVDVPTYHPRKQAAKRLYLDAPTWDQASQFVQDICRSIAGKSIPTPGQVIFGILRDEITNGTGKTANPDLEA
jgi:hypothetical protein